MAAATIALGTPLDDHDAAVPALAEEIALWGGFNRYEAATGKVPQIRLLRTVSLWLQHYRFVGRSNECRRSVERAIVDALTRRPAFAD